MASVEQLQELLRTLREESAKQQAELVSRMSQQQNEFTRTLQEMRDSQQREAAALRREAQDDRGRHAGLQSRDLKALGKPENFDGTTAKWKGRSEVFRSYAGTQEPPPKDWMRHAEEQQHPVTAATTTSESGKASSQALHFMLMMTCRGPALLKVLNAGDQEGLEAWRQLVRYYEPKVRGRHAGLLSGVLSYQFPDEVEASLEGFERAILQYKKSSKKTVADDMKIGVVLNRMVDSPLKTHFFFQGERLETGVAFKEEISNIRTAQTVAQTATTPMDIGRMGKGTDAKKNIACHNCSKKGHIAKDCGAPGGGAAKGGGGGKKGKGKGKGKDKGRWHQPGGDRKGPGDGAKGKKNLTCSRCGKKGYYARECRAVLGEFTQEEKMPKVQRTHEEASKAASSTEPAVELGGPLGNLGKLCLQSEEELSEYLGSLEAEVEKLRATGGFQSVRERLGALGALTCSKIRIGVDTCAAATVAPETVGSDHPITSGTVQSFRSVSGNALQNLSERLVDLKIGKSKGVHKIRSQVVKGLIRPLISVSATAAVGGTSIFRRNELGQRTESRKRRSP